jgi:hypothetical protein
VLVETNGFDLPDISDPLPSTGLYYDRQGVQYSFSLNIDTFRPLNDLEQRMGVPLSSNAPTIQVDRRTPKVSMAEVESILFQVRDSLAMRFAEIANVDPARVEIVVEPSTFYVLNSNFGDSWAGGFTRPLNAGRYRIHVMFFYISSQRRIADWREYLISEAINFYVLAIGRPDLAR